jgi:MoaD family protein
LKIDRLGEKPTIKIKVKLFTSLREISGKKMVEIDCPSKITIKELLMNISEKFGSRFTEYLFNEKEEVRKYIQVLLNGRARGLETILEEGDTIALLPPVGGG